MDKENAMNEMFNNIDNSVNKSKPKKKRTKKNKVTKVNKSRNKNRRKSNRKLSKYQKYQRKAQAHYRNIRTNDYTVDALQGFQAVLELHNRSDVLEKMIECCKPIFLNSKKKKDKFDKMIKVINLERSLKK